MKVHYAICLLNQFTNKPVVRLWLDGKEIEGIQSIHNDYSSYGYEEGLVTVSFRVPRDSDITHEEVLRIEDARGPKERAE